MRLRAGRWSLSLGYTYHNDPMTGRLYRRWGAWVIHRRPWGEIIKLEVRL